MNVKGVYVIAALGVVGLWVGIITNDLGLVGLGLVTVFCGFISGLLVKP